VAPVHGEIISNDNGHVIRD